MSRSLLPWTAKGYRLDLGGHGTNAIVVNRILQAQVRADAEAGSVVA
jgi:hypothetical protein